MADAAGVVRRREPWCWRPPASRGSRASSPSGCDSPYQPGRRSRRLAQGQAPAHPGGRHRRLAAGHRPAGGHDRVAAARRPGQRGARATSARSAPASPTQALADLGSDAARPGAARPRRSPARCRAPTRATRTGSSPCSSARCGSASGPVTGGCGTRPGAACGPTRPRGRRPRDLSRARCPADGAVRSVTRPRPPRGRGDQPEHRRRHRGYLRRVTPRCRPDHAL